MQKPSAKEMVQQMLDMVNALAESASDIAHAKRRLYEAYVAEGFSAHEALELIKSGSSF